MLICICNEMTDKETCLEVCHKGKRIKPDVVGYVENWPKGKEETQNESRTEEH